MALHSPPARTTNDRAHVPAGATPMPTTAAHEESAAAPPPASAARGVLGGAFAVLEALAQADAGLGLSGLARASGLAKTSAYRLAEQLVGLGAIQRVDRRYYVGARVGRIGQQWQPDPLLRRAAQTTVHALAVKSRAVASPLILLRAPIAHDLWHDATRPCVHAEPRRPRVDGPHCHRPRPLCDPARR